jgi:hypothetical protein
MGALATENNKNKISYWFGDLFNHVNPKKNAPLGSVH